MNNNKRTVEFFHCCQVVIFRKDNNIIRSSWMVSTSVLLFLLLFPYRFGSTRRQYQYPYIDDPDIFCNDLEKKKRIYFATKHRIYLRSILAGLLLVLGIDLFTHLPTPGHLGQNHKHALTHNLPYSLQLFLLPIP